jgi:hypothetical protein
MITTGYEDKRLISKGTEQIVSQPEGCCYETNVIFL